MGRISTDQSHQVVGALIANADWSQIDFDAAHLQDLVIRNAREAGAQFTEFLKNGCRVQVVTGDFLRETGEVTVEIPALPRPALGELKKRWPWISRIERDSSTEEAVTLVLATVLGSDEKKAIGGNEYERRLVSGINRLLGYQHREWLLEHQDEFPALKALLGKVYIDFPGLIVVNGGGDRRYPYADRFGDRWDGRWDWLSLAFRSLGRVAVSRK